MLLNWISLIRFRIRRRINRMKVIKKIFKPLDFHDPNKLFIGFCECLATAALLLAMVLVVSGAWRFYF